MQIHQKLLIAAFACGVALSLGALPAAAQTGSESEQPRQNQKKGKAADQGAQKNKATTQDQKNQQARGEQGRQRPTLLLGVVTVTPLVTTDPALPRGAKYDEQVENGDQMRASLASITGAVFQSDGELNDVIDHFVDADRDRLDKQPMREADFERGQLTQLKDRVAEIKKAWSDKYGEEFNIAQNEVYGSLLFAEGEITDARQFKQRWPVTTAVGPGMQGPGPAARAGAESGRASEQTRDQTNIEKGRNFGIARFPAGSGLPAANVSFIDEAFGWKIDVPDGITTAQLRNNLLRHLTMLRDHADMWPANVNDAYRLASHHVVMALYGITPSRS